MTYNLRLKCYGTNGVMSRIVNLWQLKMMTLTLTKLVRDSYEEEDQNIEVSTKKILNKDGKLAIPEIHKHFAL